MTTEFASIVLGTLMSIAITLSGWTLYTVHGIAVGNAGRDAKETAQDETLAEDRARIIEIEEDVETLKTDVAVLKARAD